MAAKFIASTLRASISTERSSPWEPSINQVKNSFRKFILEMLRAEEVWTYSPSSATAFECVRTIFDERPEMLRRTRNRSWDICEKTTC